MDHTGRHHPRCITVLLALYAVSAAFRLPAGNFPLYSASVLVLFVACIYWAASIKARVTHKYQRRLLIAVAGMILLLHFMQFLKYNFVEYDILGQRYLWYLYYIPMIYAPLFGLYAALWIERTDNDRLDRRWLLLLIPAVVLSVLVVTNDLHYLMFSFDPISPDWDSDYTRGIVYYVTMVWSYVMPPAGLLYAIRRCSIATSRKRGVIPLFIILGGIVLMLVFYGSTSGGRKIFGVEIFTFQMIWGMIQVLFWETCVMIGFISSNSDYDSIFRNSRVRAQILDRNGNVVYSARDAGQVPDSIRKTKGIFTASSEGDVKIYGRAIEGGYIYWQEDISAVLRINSDLAETAARLREENTLLSQENELKREQARIDTLNALYDEIDTRIKDRRVRVRELLTGLRSSGDPEFREGILYASILVAYIKRTANLMLTGRGEAMINAQDLKLAISESLEYAGFSGITGAASLSGEGSYDIDPVLSAYALFEEILERGFGIISAFMVWIRAGASLELQMELSGNGHADEDSWVKLKDHIRTYAVKTGGYRLISMDADDEGTLVVRSFFAESAVMREAEP